MSELEEGEHAELLRVVAIGEPVITQHGAGAPELLHDAVGFRAHGGLQGWGVIAMSVIWPCLGPQHQNTL